MATTAESSRKLLGMATVVIGLVWPWSAWSQAVHLYVPPQVVPAYPVAGAATTAPMPMPMPMHPSHLPFVSGSYPAGLQPPVVPARQAGVVVQPRISHHALTYDPNAPQQSSLSGLDMGRVFAEIEAQARQTLAQQDAYFQQLMAQQAQNAPRGLDFGQIALLAEATNQYREARQQQQQQQPQPTSAPMFYNPGTGQFFRNGMVIDEDDDAGFVALAEAPSPEDGVYAKPGSADWIGMLPHEVNERLRSIKDPSVGKLMSKNWDIGVSNMKLMTGELLYQAGAEELGSAVIERQSIELQKNAPYNR